MIILEADREQLYRTIISDDVIRPVPDFGSHLRSLVGPAAPIHMLYALDVYADATNPHFREVMGPKIQGYPIPISSPQSRGLTYLFFARDAQLASLDPGIIDGLYIRALGETRGATSADKIPEQLRLETVVERATAAGYFSAPVLWSMVESGVIESSDGFDLVLDYAANVGKMSDSEFLAVLVRRATRGHNVKAHDSILSRNIAPELAIENLIRVYHGAQRHDMPQEAPLTKENIERLILSIPFQPDVGNKPTPASSMLRQKLLDLLLYGDQDSHFAPNWSREAYAQGQPLDPRLT